MRVAFSLARLLLLLGLTTCAAGGVWAQNEADGASGGADGNGVAGPLLNVRVDPAGGPLTLEEDLHEALAAWQDAGAEELSLEVEDEADDRVLYGDPDRLGPDVVSLTLRRSDRPGVELRMHPRGGDRLRAALLHELGRLAGLERSGQGVLDPALREDGPVAPTEDDVQLWRERAAFAPEDLNRDGVVDFHDLARLAEAYGNRGVRLPEDLDGSGVVDEGDLERLRGAYRFLAPSPEPPQAAPDEAPQDADAPELQAEPEGESDQELQPGEQPEQEGDAEQENEAEQESEAERDREPSEDTPPADEAPDGEADEPDDPDDPDEPSGSASLQSPANVETAEARSRSR